MVKYFKLFNTHEEYEAYTADTSSFILPNVSYCIDTPIEVHYNPLRCDETTVYDIIGSPLYPSTIEGDATSFDITVNYRMIDTDLHCKETVIEGTDTIRVECGANPSTASSRTVSGTVEWNGNEIEYSLTQNKFEEKVTAKFNVTSTSKPTRIASGTTNFSKIEIDGVEQPSVVTGHTFDTIGEHTIKYTLKDPTSIGGNAFYGCSRLTSVTIPDSVTSIGYNAFYGCSRLTSVTIPDSVTSIGSSAFQNCSGLTSCTIGSGVRSIGREAFYYCNNLEGIVIPDSVTSIGQYAFQYCSSLTSCTIGSGVTSIGYGAFQGCRSLTSINIPSGVTSIGDMAFSYCYGLTSIDIPDSVTSIGNEAFSGCTSLTSIVIPDSVTSIGHYAFYNCTSLTSITVDSDNTVYDSRNNCNAIIETNTNTLIQGCKNTTIPDSVTSIGNEAFRDCTSLESIDIPDSVTTIGNYAFFGCRSLTSIDIPDSVTSIGYYAFYECSSLTSCTIGSGVTSIGNSAFAYCSSLTSITVEATTPPTLSVDVFYNTNNCPIIVPCGSVDTYKAATGWSGYSSRIQAIRVTSVELDTNTLQLLEYETHAFSATVLPVNACDNVTWSSSDNSIVSVDSNGVASGVSMGNATVTVTTVDGGYTDSCSLTVPSQNAIITYVASSKLPETTSTGSTIGLHVNSFSGTSGQELTMTSHTFKNGVGTIVFNNDVTSIGNYAFYECTSLSSIDIPDSVTSIGNYVFYNCGITNIEIPNSVTSIGENAFEGCKKLGSCTLGSGVTSISYGTFQYCTSLESIVIPDNVTTIGYWAFAYCSGLTTITSNATTAPTIQSNTFLYIRTNGTLYVPIGSSGYDVWMQNANYYLGKYNWTKVEQ